MKNADIDIQTRNQEALAKMCPELFSATASAQEAAYGSCDPTPLEMSADDREFLFAMDGTLN